MTLRNIIINGKNILSRQQTSILSAAFVLAAAFTVSALLGILRDRFLYERFYSCCTAQLDAYNAAFRIPDIIFRLLVIGALSAAFIPVFSDHLSKDKAAAYRLARATITFLTLVFTVLSIIVFVFAVPFSSLITANFSSYQVNLMASLTRWMLLAQLFFLLSNFLTSILQVKRRFLLPALSPVIYNLAIIAGIKLLGPIFGIYGPAIGVLLGSFLHFLIQLPLAVSLGFSFKPDFSFRLPGVKRILHLMVPRSLSLGLGEIESTVVLFLATALPTGSLSLLYLAQHLGQLPARLFGSTIGQAALPSLSNSLSQKKEKEFAKILLDSLLQALFLTIPIAVAVLFLRLPIIRLAFGTREFPWQATLDTGKVLAFLTPSIVAQTGIQILTRGFYSLQDTKTPFTIAIFSLATNVVIGIAGIYWLNLGILALVIAMSLASLIQFFLLFFSIVTRINEFPWQRIFGFLLKVGISSAVAGVCFWVSMKVLDAYVLDSSRVIGLLVLTVISFCFGISAYLIFTSMMAVEEVKVYANLIKKLFFIRQTIASSTAQLEKQKEIIETPTGF